MAKIRVHELAKKLERTNREVMDALKGIGVDVKSHMSNVEDTQAEKIREKFKMTGKEQKVESPNNEKNLNKQEETPKKKKNIIRVYHAQNASDGGRRKQGERKKGDRRPGQGRPQNSNRPAQNAAVGKPQGERAAENRENNFRGNNNQGGAPRNGEGRPAQSRQGGRQEGQEGRRTEIIIAVTVPRTVKAAVRKGREDRRAEMEETAPAVLSRNDRITARKAREDRRAAAVEDL